MRPLVPVLVLCVSVTLSSVAGAQSPGRAPVIPADAVALEGRPAVRVEVTPEGTTRQLLNEQGAEEARLAITMRDGRYYWGNDPGRPLLLRRTGEFTYLSTSEPGHYVKFTQINDRIQYVEHLDQALGSVTYWGELRVVLGR